MDYSVSMVCLTYGTTGVLLLFHNVFIKSWTLNMISNSIGCSNCYILINAHNWPSLGSIFIISFHKTYLSETFFHISGFWHTLTENTLVILFFFFFWTCTMVYFEVLRSDMENYNVIKQYHCSFCLFVLFVFFFLFFLNHGITTGFFLFCFCFFHIFFSG